jgi:hypothetical protein
VASAGSGWGGLWWEVDWVKNEEKSKKRHPVVFPSPF